MKRIFFIAAIITGFVSCKSGSNAALKYNQRIVEMDRSVQPEEQLTEDRVGRFYNEGKYDSIGAAGEHMETVLQKTIDDIQSMPSPDAKGIEDFKAAALKYFAYFKSIYTVYKEFGMATTEEKRQELIDKKQDLWARRDDAVKELQQAQKIFSDANGFRMQ